MHYYIYYSYYICIFLQVLPEVETIALNNLKKSLNHYEGLKQKEENGTTSE